MALQVKITSIVQTFLPLFPTSKIWDGDDNIPEVYFNHKSSHIPIKILTVKYVQLILSTYHQFFLLLFFLFRCFSLLVKKEKSFWFI